MMTQLLNHCGPWLDEWTEQWERRAIVFWLIVTYLYNIHIFNISLSTKFKVLNYQIFCLIQILKTQKGPQIVLNSTFFLACFSNTRKSQWLQCLKRPPLSPFYSIYKQWCYPEFGAHFKYEILKVCVR